MSLPQPEDLFFSYWKKIKEDRNKVESVTQKICEYHNKAGQRRQDKLKAIRLLTANLEISKNSTVVRIRWIMKMRDQRQIKLLKMRNRNHASKISTEPPRKESCVLWPLSRKNSHTLHLMLLHSSFCIVFSILEKRDNYR